MNFVNDYIDTWCCTRWELTQYDTQNSLTTLINDTTYNAGSDLWLISEDDSNLRLPTSLYISTDMYIQGTLTQGYDTTLIKTGSQPTRNIYWTRGEDGDNVITTKNIYIDGNLYIQGSLYVNQNLSGYDVITPSVPTTEDDYVQWKRITDGTQNNHGTYTDKKVMVKANVFVKGIVYQSIPFSSLGVSPNSLVPYIKVGERNIADGAVQYNHLENTLLQFFKSFVGQVAYYAMNTPPVGWLVCDGSLLNRTDYTNLFAVISTTYGTTTSTNFRLPDFRGKFLRSYDSTGTIDPPYQEVATSTNTSTTISALQNAYSIAVGSVITSSVANVIQAGTTVIAILSATSLQMSLPALATNSVQTLTFTRQFGGLENDSLQGHGHNNYANRSAQSGSATNCLRTDVSTVPISTHIKEPINLAGYGEVKYTTETRPINHAVLCCIKY
jgi:microcystin-dependent protein